MTSREKCSQAWHGYLGQLLISLPLLGISRNEIKYTLEYLGRSNLTHICLQQIHSITYSLNTYLYYAVVAIRAWSTYYEESN